MLHDLAIPQIDSSVFDASFLQDPYPLYARIRELGPVVRLNDPSGMSWVFSHYADVAALQRDAGNFSSRQRIKTLVARMPETALAEFAYILRGLEMFMLLNDGVQHAARRRVLQTAFTNLALENMRADVVALADELIERTEGREQIEFVEAFGLRFPAYVIMRILGVPRQHFEECMGWSELLTEFVGQIRGLDLDKMRAAQRALHSMMELFRGLMALRRAAPADDLMSYLVQAQQSQGTDMSDDEVLAQCCLLLVGGNDNTRALLSSGVRLLLTQRLRPADVLATRETLDGFIEETLRYESPLQFVRRTAVQDVEIHGLPIAKDDSVLLLVGAANRDPSRFGAPDIFDIGRSENRHLAFGFGPHLCIAGGLARFEARIAFERWFRRYPDTRLVDAQPNWRRNPAFRGLARLGLAVR